MSQIVSSLQGLVHNFACISHSSIRAAYLTSRLPLLVCRNFRQYDIQHNYVKKDESSIPEDIVCR